MIYPSYETRLKEAAAKAANLSELTDYVNDIVADMLNENEIVWSIDYKWSGYCSWRVSLWLNRACFGSEFALLVGRKYFITHDEDKEYVLEDFAEILDDVAQEYAYTFF